MSLTGNDKQILEEFIEWFGENYYYNSSCWCNYETDQVDSKEEIIQNFEDR